MNEEVQQERQARRAMGADAQQASLCLVKQGGRSSCRRRRCHESWSYRWKGSHRGGGYIRELGGGNVREARIHSRPSGIVLHQPKWQVHMWSLMNPDKWQNCAA
ncbi:unnamed protein product [Urochloa humidicola]